MAALRMTPGNPAGTTNRMMAGEANVETMAGVNRRAVGLPTRTASAILWSLLLALLATGLAVRWSLLRTQPLDFDEFQHLHVAWCYTQDLVPYRDFWDNHPPLLHIVLTWLQPVSGESVEAIFTARAAMFVMALGVFGVVFGLTRAVFDSATGLAAVALLACVQVFTDKTVEVRPDSGLILFGVLSLWCLLLTLKTRSTRSAYAYCIAAGCAFGAATLFSTKSMMLAAALLVALGALGILRRRNVRLRSVFIGAATFAVGLLTALLPCGFYFAFRGGLADLSRFTVLDNLTYPERFSAMGWLEPGWSMPLAIVLVLGMALLVFGQFRGRRPRDASLVLVIVAAVLVVEFAVIMPAPYAQSACLPIVFLVIPGGWLLRSAIRWLTDPGHSAKRRWCGGTAALLMILGGPVDSLLRSRLAHQGDAAELQRQLALTQSVLDVTGPNDALFADYPVAIFRRHACFHPALTSGVLHRYRHGETPNTIAEDLRRFGCTLVVKTHPPRPLPNDDRLFIREHFVPSGPSRQVPGQTYSAAQLRAGDATFDAIADGIYKIEANGSVSVDAVSVSGEVFLEAGRHSIQCADPTSPVRIHRPPGQ